MFNRGVYRVRKEDAVQLKEIYRPLSYIWTHPSFQESKEVSFCIWVNQADLNVIGETLRQNLINNYADRQSTEFVILICGQNTGVENFVANFSDEIGIGYVRIYCLENDVDDKIKNNLVFQLGKGKVLSGLAFDDYTGPRAANYIRKTMTCEWWSRAVWMKKKRKQSKRLSVSRDTFYELGGFDESHSSIRQVENLTSRLENYQVQIVTLHVDIFLNKFGKRKEDWRFIRRRSNKLRCEMTNLQDFEITDLI